ncbi:transporter substrate-binding domain-containing protein [Falsirhodobacter sp. alg1]|uniref:transporter substrate-binding domain-containing protein n=1 Tax=Falsirhodobacter sp. alg1 TaxID=1472418 RepID=UPI0005EF03A0|nr:transporter substrate-binding domain-containing protein [Falsirhodobacter sp. alg1]
MRLMTLVAAFALCAGAAHADLADIKAAGKIRIAVAMGIPQYSYIDSSMHSTGSDVETARRIAADLGVDLELIEITNAARVPTVQTGKADLVVSSLGITDERKKAIDFSVPYATLAIIVAAPEDVDIKNYADLTGKRVGVTRATTNDQDLAANATGVDIMRFEDDATLITAVISGQVDILSSQPTVLAGINAKRGGTPIEVKFVQKETNLGIGMAKGNPELEAWTNDWIKTHFADGSLRELFSEFHHRDLPDDLTSR